MKVIKKYSKVVLCFMAFAILSFIFAFNPSLSAYAALNATGTAVITELNALKMPTTFDVAKSTDKKLSIPLLKNQTNYTVRVIDPAGQEHNHVVSNSTTSTTDSYFEVASEELKISTLTNGTYKVVYSVEGTDGKTYYSNTYRIAVTNVSYELNFTMVDGKVALVKPTVAANSALVKLPSPTVREVGKTTDVENAKFSIEVTRNGDTLTTATEVTDESEVTENDFFVKIGDDYYVNPSITSAEAAENKESAKFTIKYSYKEGANQPSKTFIINVVKGFEEPNELELSTPTLPKFELGDKEIELPKPTLKNEYNNSVEYNIESIVIEKEDDSNIKLTLENNTTKFDMTLKAFQDAGVEVDSYDDLIGNYLITYNVVDAYGKTAPQKQLRKENVTISTNPTAYMAYNYTITETSGVKTVDVDVDTKYASDFKNEYLYSNIVLPGIYGEDKISDFNDLVLVRTIVDSDTREVYYVDNYKYDSANHKAIPLTSADNGNAAITEEVTETNINEYVLAASSARTFKFDGDDTAQSKKVGKYILRYEVYSKNIKSRTGKLVDPTTQSEYTFQVTATKSNTTPEIKISNLSNTVAVTKDDEITVKVSATDKKVSDTDNVDTRLNTAVYVVNTTDDEDTILAKFQAAITEANSNVAIGESNLFKGLTISGYTLTPATLDEEKANTYKLKATADGDVIVAVTYNDYATVDIDTRTITLKNTENDSVPPIYSVLKANSFNTDASATTIQQLSAVVGDKIMLPNIQFTDTADSGYNGDSSLAMNVAYYIDSPETSIGLKYLSPSDCMFTNDTVYGGKITASQKGTYYVLYTATDDAGNTNVVTFSFVVTEEVKQFVTPDVSSEDESFNFANGIVTAESGAIISIEGTDEAGNMAQVKISQDGLYYEPMGDNKYQFYGVGTYNVELVHASNNEITRSFKIKIEKQELNWTEEITTVPESGVKGEEVFLPMATTNDGSIVNVKVTKGKNGEEIDVEYVNNGWTFTPSENGVYYVTYSAENVYTVLDSEPFQINVGDTYPPVITMTQKTALSQDIVYDGTNNIEFNFDIDTSKKTLIITAVSNGNQIYSINTGLSITDKTATGTNNNTYSLWNSLKVELTSTKDIVEEIEQDTYDYQFVISGTGTCTIKLTAEDDYDKVGEYEITFNVVSSTEPTEKNDNVAGIVLIITSAVILVGVIAFFALTGKKGGSKKSKKSKVSAETVEVENKSETKVEKQEEVKAEETKVEEVETTDTVENAETETTETSEEAKTGEIEE